MYQNGFLDQTCKCSEKIPGLRYPIKEQFTFSIFYIPGDPEKSIQIRWSFLTWYIIKNEPESDQFIMIN